jgi:hypothetical protein
LINISLDYNVVINPYSSPHSIMKLIILHLDSVNKPSLISENAAEIRISNLSCKGINLTTQHM